MLQHPGPIEMLLLRGRFKSVERGLEEYRYLYVVELNNGFVKIGWTSSPRGRMPSLDKQFKRHFGARIARFHLSPPLPKKGVIELERSLIARAVAAGGKTTAIMTELFSSGLSYDAAVALVREATEV